MPYSVKQDKLMKGVTTACEAIVDVNRLDIVVVLPISKEYRGSSKPIATRCVEFTIFSKLFITMELKYAAIVYPVVVETVFVLNDLIDNYGTVFVKLLKLIFVVDKLLTIKVLALTLVKVYVGLVTSTFCIEE